MKIHILLLSLIAFMSSCASNSNSKNKIKNLYVSHDAKLKLADKSSQEKIICKQMKRNGSNRIITVCQSQSETELARDNTQKELKRKIIKTSASTQAGEKFVKRK